MQHTTLGLLAILGLGACNPCQREACDAMEKLARKDGERSRVAGIVASDSDVVENGCAECHYAEVPVRAWPREGELSAAEELSAVTSADPVASATSTGGKYALALDPGDYLVCVSQYCFNVSVEAQGTTTLNVRLLDGPAVGAAALPGASEVTRISSYLLL